MAEIVDYGLLEDTSEEVGEEIEYIDGVLGNVPPNQSSYAVAETTSVHVAAFFCGIYEIEIGPPLYRSPATLIVNATNHSQIDNGQHLKVVIKFMKNEAAYIREQAVRSSGGNLEGSSCPLDPQYVVELLESPDSKLMWRDMQTRVHPFTGEQLANYPFVLVLAAGDRSLESAFRFESLCTIGADLRDEIAIIMKDVCECLFYLHSLNVIHGGMSMSNIVRMQGSYKLIDMKASCSMSEGQNVGIHDGGYATSIMPPEFFYELKGEKDTLAYEGYWHLYARAASRQYIVREIPADPLEAEEQARLANIWDCRLAPRAAKNNALNGHPRLIVGKFFMSHDENVWQTALPYNRALLRASNAVDMWSLGALLFKCHSGSPLFATHIATTDLKHASDASILYDWSQDCCSGDREIRIRVSEEISDPVAADLVLMLLRCDPSDRPNCITEVLSHPYFHRVLDQLGQLDAVSLAQAQGLDVKNHVSAKTAQARFFAQKEKEMLERIRKDDEKRATLEATAAAMGHKAVLLSDASLNVACKFYKLQKMLFKNHQISSSSGRMHMQGVLESMPSCFVVLNQKLELGDDLISTARDEEPLLMGDERMQERAMHAENMINYLFDVSFVLREALTSDAPRELPLRIPDPDCIFSAYPTQPMANGYQPHVLYLYLVDEHTLKPHVLSPNDEGFADCPYPIVIHDPLKFFQQFISLVLINLKAIHTAHGAIGLARAIGYPFSQLPAGLTSLIEHAMGDTSYAKIDNELKLLREVFPHKLIPGWKLQIMEGSGSLFYFNILTGEMQSDMPLAPSHARCDSEPFLLSGWHIDVNEDGRTIFVNSSTGATTSKIPYNWKRGALRLDVLEDYAELLRQHDSAFNCCGLKRCIAVDGSYIWASEKSIALIQEQSSLLAAAESDSNKMAELEIMLHEKLQEVASLTQAMEEQEQAANRNLAEFAASHDAHTEKLLIHIQELNKYHEAVLEEMKEMHAEELAKAVYDATNIKHDKPVHEVTYLQSIVSKTISTEAGQRVSVSYPPGAPVIRTVVQTENARRMSSSPYDRLQNKRNSIAMTQPPSQPHSQPTDGGVRTSMNAGAALKLFHQIQSSEPAPQMPQKPIPPQRHGRPRAV